MISCIRTNFENPDFIKLVAALDKELKIRDGKDHDFYHQFNKIENINDVVVAYADINPVGCGALKSFDKQTMELKRMYVVPQYRNKGVATAILIELEKLTSELGFRNIILETGIKQPEAISLYKKNHYTQIENYGQYINVANSVCFKKNL